MRIIICAFLLIFCLFFLTCMSGSSPGIFSTEEEEEELATAIIGPAGGDLVSDELILTVPDGAFDTDTNLTLYTTSAEGPFSESSVTATYRIDGLPESFSKALVIGVQYEGELTDRSVLGIGEPVFFPETDSLAVVYDLITAVDSSGFLWGSIPADLPDVAGKRTGFGNIMDGSEGKSLHIKGATDYCEAFETFNKHFLVTCPNRIKNKVLTSTVVWENSYNMIEQMGFIHTPVQIPVIVNKTSKAPNEFAHSFPWWKPIIFLDEQFYDLDDWDENEYLLSGPGREVMHLILYANDPFYLQSDNKTPKPERFWLHAAVMSWIEGKINFVVRDAYFDWQELFSSLKPFSTMNSVALSRYIGIARTVVIKYLAEQFGNECIVNLYSNEIGFGMDPLPSLIKVADTYEDTHIWWRDFVRYYLSPYYYQWTQDIGGFWHVDIEKAKEAFPVACVDEIKTKNDTLFVYPVVPRDLSATVFAVRLMYNGLDEKSKVRFKVTPESTSEADKLSLLVYAVNSERGRYQYLGDAAREFTVNDVKTFMDEGKGDLFAVLVYGGAHPPDYQSYTYADMEIRVMKEEFNKCAIDVIFSGTYQYSWGGTGTLTNQLSWSGPVTLEGSGNRFEGSWENLDGTTVTEGGIVVEFSPSTLQITSFVAADTTRDVTESEPATIKRIVGGGIPVTYNEATRSYTAYGSDVANYVQLIQHEDRSAVGYQLISYSFVTDGYLNIMFSNE